MKILFSSLIQCYNNYKSRSIAGSIKQSITSDIKPQIDLLVKSKVNAVSTCFKDLRMLWNVMVMAQQRENRTLFYASVLTLWSLHLQNPAVISFCTHTLHQCSLTIAPLGSDNIQDYIWIITILTWLRKNHQYLHTIQHKSCAIGKRFQNLCDKNILLQISYWSK